jgi:hypothetical protein
MSKKHQHKSGSETRKRVRLAAAKRKRDAAAFSHPSDLLNFISRLWEKEAKKPGDGRANLVWSTLGTVIGAKLLIRLLNDGSLRCNMDPEVVYVIETESDEMAVSAFAPVQDLAPMMSRLLGEDNPSAPRVRYLRAVTTGTDWRWTTKKVDGDTVIPPDFIDLLQDTRDQSLDVAARIITHFGKQRLKATNQASEVISQMVASFAAAKWCLSIWGNESRAAIIERLAEKASEREYQVIQELKREELEQRI